MIVSIMGAVLGTVIGILFGLALVAALRDQGFSAYRVPVGSLAAFLVVAGVLGIIAAALPARRAARLNVLHAIAQE